MKRILSIMVVFALMLTAIADVYAAETGWKYIDWESKADGVNVTAYKDNVFEELGEFVPEETDDPLAAYELAAFGKWNDDTGMRYGLKLNLYKLKQFLDGNAQYADNTAESRSFSFNLHGGKTDSIYVLQNGAWRMERSAERILRSGWELVVLDTAFWVTVTGNEDDGFTAEISYPVIEEEAPPAEESIEAEYDYSLCRVNISAYIPGCSGEPVSIFLEKNDSPGELGYINVVSGDDEDRIDFSFKFAGDIEAYSLGVNFDGVRREVPVLTVISGAVPEGEITITDNRDGTATFVFDKIDAFYGVYENSRLIITYYNSDEVLVGCTVSRNWADTVTDSIPDGTKKIKCYAWESIESLVPLGVWNVLAVSK